MQINFNDFLKFRCPYYIKIMAKSILPKLYKQLVNESMKFSDYNFRSHALRIAQYKYESLLDETDESKIKDIAKNLENDIAVTTRQTVIGQLYAAEKHILDTKDS